MLLIIKSLGAGIHTQTSRQENLKTKGTPGLVKINYTQGIAKGAYKHHEAVQRSMNLALPHVRTVVELCDKTSLHNRAGTRKYYDHEASEKERSKLFIGNRLLQIDLTLMEAFITKEV